MLGVEEAVRGKVGLLLRGTFRPTLAEKARYQVSTPGVRHVTILTAPIRYGRSIRWLLCAWLAYLIWSCAWSVCREPDDALASIPASVILRKHPD